MTVSLAGKTAIVTGSGAGLGAAYANALAAAGAAVVVNDVSSEAAESTVAAIRDAGGKAVAVVAPVGSSEVAQRLVDTAVTEFGGLDILVNNAGIQHTAPVEDFPPEQWERIIRINLSAVFYGIHWALPHLRPKGWGRIINIASVHGLVASVHKAAYIAAKHGVVGLTKTVAKEWGQFKINVNAVAFGFVETRLTAAKEEAGTFEKDGQEIKLGIPEQMRQMASMLIPLGRPATPEEAAGGIFFLCSPWSNYVHGQVLNVTGGQFTGMTT